MVNAIRDRANRHLCPSFEQMDTNTTAGKPDPFPCFRPGLAALSVCQGATAVALTLGISSFVAPNDLVKIVEFAALIFIFGLMLVFLNSFNGELFKLEDSMQLSRYSWVRWMGRHVGLSVSLLVAVFSVIMALMPLVHVW